MRRPNLSLPILLVPFLFLSCNSSSPSSLKEDTFETRHFLEKASLLLRSGTLPSPNEEARWLAQDRATAVAEMMQDPAFGTTVLDFGLFFLGARPLNIRQYDNRWQAMQFAQAVYSHPSAIHAAKETLAGGNFLTLLEATQPLYLAPIARYSDEPRGDDVLSQLFQTGEALFAPGSTGTVSEACDALIALEIENQIQQIMREARFQESLTDGLRLAYRRTVLKRCYENSEDPIAAKAATTLRLQALKARVDLAYSYESTQNAANYPQRFVTDIRDAADTVPGLAVTGELLTREGFWRTYVNSSTNYNRKRAQYVLDRFFCDDLTPLDLPNPVPHGADRHATDPSCQSCHYRLDPMGGFFRQIGNTGRNREGSDYIDFDDMAVLTGEQMQHYLDFWKEPDPNAGREWKVGYIRDPADPSRNIYGSSLGDLLGLLKTQAEVRQCLVKRLAEFVLGSDQVIDGRWLKNAGEPLAAATDENSADALKTTLTTLVLSQTFAAHDPDPETCYDLPADAPASAVPCRISWVLEKNCKSCHSGPEARAGLDLTGWITAPDGSHVFPHVAEVPTGETRQLTRSESFDRIRARLSTTDDSEIMPPRYMHPTERVELLHFLETSEETP